MIPFKVLCEELTIEQLYSYFGVTETLFSYLTDEDKALVYVQQLPSGSYRLFYPKEKYIQSMPPEALKRLLMEAIDASDFQKILTLKQEMKRRNNERIQ